MRHRRESETTAEAGELDAAGMGGSWRDAEMLDDIFKYDSKTKREFRLLK